MRAPTGSADTPSQSHDGRALEVVRDLIRVPAGGGQVRTRPDAVLGDKAYSSRANRSMLRNRRIQTAIPEPADQQPTANAEVPVVGGHRTSTPTCTSSVTP